MFSVSVFLNLKNLESSAQIFQNKHLTSYA